MPPTMAEWMSVSVAAATRAAKVDALSSWSACRTSAQSMARTARASGASTGELVEKVGGKAHHRIRIDWALVLLETPDGRDEAGHLRRQADGLTVVGRGRVVGGVAVVVRQRRSRGAERVHRLARWQLPKQPDHAVGQGASRGKLRLQVAQLRAVRQPPVPQQVTDFLERRVRRQIVDVVPAIGQDPAVAVDETDARRGRDDVFEAGFGFDLGAHG